MSSEFELDVTSWWKFEKVEEEGEEREGRGIGRKIEMTSVPCGLVQTGSDKPGRPPNSALCFHQTLQLINCCHLYYFRWFRLVRSRDRILLFCEQLCEGDSCVHSENPLQWYCICVPKSNAEEEEGVREEEETDPQSPKGWRRHKCHLKKGTNSILWCMLNSHLW